jgi:hypothetical protein
LVFVGFSSKLNLTFFLDSYLYLLFLAYGFLVLFEDTLEFDFLRDMLNEELDRLLEDELEFLIDCDTDIESLEDEDSRSSDICESD